MTKLLQDVVQLHYQHRFRCLSFEPSLALLRSLQLCLSQGKKGKAMAADYEEFQKAVLRKLAARFSVAELVSAGGVTGVRGDWYARIGARLDQLPDDGGLYIGRFRLPHHPARYVWVDRHLRIWRADGRGRLRVSASLE